MYPCFEQMEPDLKVAISPCAEQPLGVGPMRLHNVSVLRADGTRPQGGHIALRGAATRHQALFVKFHSGFNE